MLRWRSTCLLAVVAAILLSLTTIATSAPPGAFSAGSAADSSSDSNPSTIVEVPPLARSLGLGATATPEQMAEVLAKIGKTWKLGGFGCGPAGCASFYHTLLPGDEKETYVTIEPAPAKNNPSGQKTGNLSGPGFIYRFQDGVFVLHLTKPSR
jgi:hypothetical protein